MLKGHLAHLERALGNFMLDIHTQEFGYTEISPPLLVRENIMYGTAQLPKFRDDQFKVTGAGLVDVGRFMSDFQIQVRSEMKDAGEESLSGEAFNKIMQSLVPKFNERIKEGDYSSFWLIPTAEVPLTNIVNDMIIEREKLPFRFTAKTPCFRAEAGAAGKDTR